MAYDMRAEYQPPRRGYGGYQQQEQAPVQHGYGGGRQDQYGYGQDQQYGGQAYGQGGYEQDGYAQRGPYDAAFDQGYDQPQQRPPNGYGQQPVREDRQYDPRFQQRPPGGRQQDGYGQQFAPQQDRRHASSDQQRGPAAVRPQVGYEQPQRHPRHEPGRRMDGYEQSYQPDVRQHDPRSQQAQQIRRNASHGQLPRQHASPAEPSPPPAQDWDLQSRPNPANVRQYASSQMEIEQQKQAMSKQRAQGMTPKPQPAARSNGFGHSQHQSPPPPESSKMTMAEWKAQQKAKMQADAERPEVLAQDNAFPTFPTYEHKSKGSSSTTTTDQRRGDEPPRPSTSNGVTRPIATRDNSGGKEVSGSAGQYNLPRPSLDHKPFSFDAIQNAPHAQSPPQQSPQSQYHMSASTHSSPVQERHPQNWPAQGAPQAAPHSQPDRRLPQQRVPQTQPIDTRQAQEQKETPSYMDHQPLSPVSVPPRPSTTQGARPSTRGQHSAIPPTGYSQPPSQEQHYHGSAAQPPKPWAEQSKNRETLSDIYDDYHSRKVPPPQVAPDRSREEEIESDMPDFDSAAPGGTSLLHKRSKKFDQPLDRSATAPPMPTMQPNDYGQPAKQQGSTVHGFAFGIPGEQLPPEQPYESAYQQQGYSPPQQQSARVQAPFANDQAPQRSMDDARQMQYRQAPPQQQRPPPNGGPPNGQPARGPMPPYMRPDMERGYTSATVRSDPGPGMARSGTAPPMRQGFQSPAAAHGPNGVPLPQQRPAPNQHNAQQRHSNPDALPAHPAPANAGLMNGGSRQAAKPPPVRNYGGTSPPVQQAHPRHPSIDITSKPVTHQELDQLRAQVSTNPNNHKAALALAKRLVEASNVLASEGGRLDQRSTAKNRERYINDAHKIVKRLVSKNYPEAQFYLADCYSSGQLGLAPDTREAFNLYQAAAKGGQAEAAFRTAMCCELGSEEGGGTRRDYAKALQWYRRAATLGDPNGAFKLGIILLKGLIGQQKNIGEAVIWLKRAAERATQDNPQSLFEMAQLYESTNTNPEVRNKVVADDAYALELFQKAAKWGHKKSQFRMGQAYEYGTLGLQIDNRASITWYTKAAAQGEHNAELALSGWYLTGADDILEQSDTEAYLWARKAASSEPPLAKAMFAMGYFTETGIGCPSSLEEAKRWYGRAASYKFPKAAERLEELRRNGGKGSRPAPVNGKLARKDQKRDEAECVVM